MLLVQQFAKTNPSPLMGNYGVSKRSGYDFRQRPAISKGPSSRVYGCSEVFLNLSKFASPGGLYVLKHLCVSGMSGISEFDLFYQINENTRF